MHMAEQACLNFARIWTSYLLRGEKVTLEVSTPKSLNRIVTKSTMITYKNAYNNDRFQLFVGSFLSYLRHVCLFVYGGVKTHMVLRFYYSFRRLVYPTCMLPVSNDC